MHINRDLGRAPFTGPLRGQDISVVDLACTYCIYTVPYFVSNEETMAHKRRVKKCILKSVVLPFTKQRLKSLRQGLTKYQGHLPI